LSSRAHSQARRSISPSFMTMGLRRCGRNSVGASTGSLRRPVAFSSLSICNARRHALGSPSMSWVNSKASSNAGENLRSIPWRRAMPWKRSLRLPITGFGEQRSSYGTRSITVHLLSLPRCVFHFQSTGDAVLVAGCAEEAGYTTKRTLDKRRIIVHRVAAKTTRLRNNMPLSSLLGRRWRETVLPFHSEWQRIVATTFLAPRRINRGIGPRRFCRATPPTIPDRQAVPARWSPLLDRPGSVLQRSSRA
jgi:hypothetical protein